MHLITKIGISLILVSCLMALASCRKPGVLYPDEVMERVEKCKKINMEAEVWYYTAGDNVGEASDVRCKVPKK